jgi:hypothetical protein
MFNKSVCVCVYIYYAYRCVYLWVNFVKMAVYI